MQAVTTATVQFAVNYVPQCFNANDPYSVLSRFIIIKSMVATDIRIYENSASGKLNFDRREKIFSGIVSY